MLLHMQYLSPKKPKKFLYSRKRCTAKIAENLELDINNFNSISEFVEKENIDLVIVGPENPLVNGIVDYLIKKKLWFLGLKKIQLCLKDQKYLQKRYVKNIRFHSKFWNF